MPKRKKEVLEIEVPSHSLRLQHASCPNGHSLMDRDHTINGYPSVTVIARFRDQEGQIHLDPVYGSFKTVAEIKIPDQGVVEFFCPQCRASLNDGSQTCRLCSAPMFALQLPHGGIVEGCLRNGCQFHNLKLVSGEELVKRLYDSHTLDAYL